MASRRGREEEEGGKGGDESPRDRWVPVSDDDARRRLRELQQVENFIKTVHNNTDTGLMKVIGPSLGVSGECCVLGLEGDVLGNASAAAPPPHHRDVRVLNIPPELQRKVGQPDFEKVELGLTGRGGEVRAAEFKQPRLQELVYPTHMPNTRPLQEHPKSGQVRRPLDLSLGPSAIGRVNRTRVRAHAHTPLLRARDNTKQLRAGQDHRARRAAGAGQGTGHPHPRRRRQPPGQECMPKEPYKRAPSHSRETY